MLRHRPYASSLLHVSELTKPDLHEGTPLGKFEDLHGLRTYIINPSNNNGKVDTIILLTDIYGPDYVNTQLVADEWSRQGWRVVIPDLFVGDPVPIQDIRVSPLFCSLMMLIQQAIHPKKRDQDTKSVLEKAGDTVTTTVDVGPWMYNHREAGKPFFIAIVI
jgi:dienelactone hydrolase